MWEYAGTKWPKWLTSSIVQGRKKIFFPVSSVEYVVEETDETISVGFHSGMIKQLNCTLENFRQMVVQT